MVIHDLDSVREPWPLRKQPCNLRTNLGLISRRKPANQPMRKAHLHCRVEIGRPMMVMDSKNVCPALKPVQNIVSGNLSQFAIENGPVETMSFHVGNGDVP